MDFDTPVPVTDLQPSAPGRPRRRWLWFTVPVIAVAIAIAAVVATSGSAAKSPVAVLADANGRTTGSGTRVESSVETITANGQSLEVIDISGVSDWGHKTSELTMSSQGSTVLAIRVVAGVTYMSSPLVPLPNGATWESVTPADLKLPAGGSALGSNDPGQGLKYLSAIKGNPRVVGHETVAGVDTTHYTFTLDLKAYFARVAQAQKALGSTSMGSSLENLGSFVDLTKLPGAAWIDHDGRVRRFTLTIDVEQGGESGKVVDVISFSHFDEPVSTTRPPAGDTIPFSQYPDFLTRLSTAGRSGSAT